MKHILSCRSAELMSSDPPIACQLPLLSQTPRFLRDDTEETFSPNAYYVLGGDIP